MNVTKNWVKPRFTNSTKNGQKPLDYKLYTRIRHKLY